MSKLPPNDTAQSQVDHPSDHMIWDSKFANSKILGTGDESPKNQWTAAEASVPSSRDDPAAAVDSNDTKNQCTNVANSNIHGTVNNQWTAASALMVVEVFGPDGNDASPRKASVPSARDDPATAVYLKTSKNQCTNVIISKNQGTVSGF
jgi:5-deoxy-D-glucuronate isomerase